MNDLFFSYQGRISLGRFWFATACQMACILSVLIIVAFQLQGDQEAPVGSAQIVWVLVGAMTFVAVAYSAICTGIKRFHDLNKPGIWILVQILPVIGFVWYFFETGFLKGTLGENRYGIDPLNLNPLMTNDAGYYNGR